MICIKFDQKIKKNLKNLNFGLLRLFLGFFINLKNLHFFEAIFQLWLRRGVEFRDWRRVNSAFYNGELKLSNTWRLEQKRSSTNP